MAAEPRTHHDYTVGCICALPKELTAVAAMFDETYPDLPRHRNDQNAYTFGRIGAHNVVAACLPKGEIGNNNAATVATRMTSSFPSIKFGLMIGIGGGVPKSVRLGDVVVSTPVDEFGGVVQWDFGKTQQGREFKRIGVLSRPPTELLTALTKIEKDHTMNGSKIPQYLEDLKSKWPRLASKYTRSASLIDILFRADCAHVEDPEENEYDDEEEEERGDCLKCDQTKIIRRKPREMRVHYGLIASGNQVIKDAMFRDEINRKFDGKVLCFEMEAAGLMNNFPCMVIRGICDYADAHKNKSWQEHAAAVAAGFAKELLLLVPAQEVEDMPFIKGIESQVEQVLNTVNGVQSYQMDQLSKKILDWVTPVNYAPQQNDYFSQRQEGTVQWILKSNEFQQWLIQNNQTLFCQGMPGAGKTITTATIVQHLHNQFTNDRSVGIAYVYCNFKQHNVQKSSDLIRGLLKQLLQCKTSIPEEVKTLFENHKDRQTRASINELRDMLHNVAASYSRTFILVDALDECKAEDRDRFIKEIFDLQTKQGINIFATSRFVNEITIKFKESIKLEVYARNEDVQTYLDQKLQNFPSFVQHSHPLQTEIKNKIVKAAGGMFVLARLYIESLTFMTTPKAIKLALKKLEATSMLFQENRESSKALSYSHNKVLDQAYAKAMDQIQVQALEHRNLAMKALSWIACAERQLTSSELQHAIAIEIGSPELDEENITDINLIVSVCVGLVTIDNESNIIRLVHYTTQEYFERTWKNWFPNAHEEIAKACVSYLSFDIFETGSCATHDALKGRLKSNIFYEYSANNWGRHVRRYATEEAKLEKSILDFLISPAKISACAQAIMWSIYRPIDRETGMTNLHITAYFGLHTYVAILLDRNMEIQARHFKLQTSFSVASEDSHEEDSNNINVMRVVGETPLHLAAKSGLEPTVQQQLVRSANIEAKMFTGDTPHHLAVESGHEAVVQLLLDRKANIEAKSSNGNGGTPLHLAVQHGHEAVVRLLLDRKAKTEAKGYNGKTPLHLAAEYGREAVMQQLLDRNANIEAKSSNGDTPLHLAAKSSRKPVVQLLLDRNANIEAKKYNGHTPLHLAAEYGQEAVMQLLLDRNANTEAKSSDGDTPLHLAAKSGHEAVVQLLLDRNANTEAKSSDGDTPLHLAVEFGHEAVVQLLLDRNANTEAKSSDGDTPLHLAVEFGHEAVVQLLLDRNANIEAKSSNGNGGTPLHLAVIFGHEAVVRLLLDRKANTEARDDKFNLTPRFYAKFLSPKAVVKLLEQAQHSLHSA